RGRRGPGGCGHPAAREARRPARRDRAVHRAADELGSLTNGRERLDRLLVERGLARSRERAQALILAGVVRVDGRPGTKPGTLVRREAVLSVAAPDHPFVGRGGVKLAGALDAFGIDPAGCVALDVGASPGGFTECLMTRGSGK